MGLDDYTILLVFFSYLIYCALWKRATNLPSQILPQIRTGFGPTNVAGIIYETCHILTFQVNRRRLRARKDGVSIRLCGEEGYKAWKNDLGGREFFAI